MISALIRMFRARLPELARMLRILSVAGVIWLAVWHYDREALSTAAMIVCLIGFLSMVGCVLLDNYVDRRMRALEVVEKATKFIGDHKQLPQRLREDAYHRWFIVVTSGLCTILATQLGKLKMDDEPLLLFLYLLIITIGVINVIMSYHSLQLINDKIRLVRHWYGKN